MEVDSLGRKDLKTRKNCATTVRTELLEGLRQHAVNTDIPLSRHFDRAIRLYLESEIGDDWENVLVTKKTTPLD